MSIVQFSGNEVPVREFTEPEARAAASMYWIATQCAMRRVAHWHLRKKPPTKNELHQLMLMLSWADQVGIETAKRPAGPLADFDEAIASLQQYDAALIKERQGAP